jgi:DNA-directed RNA polymerase specialized sigma24 family protein
MQRTVQPAQFKDRTTWSLSGPTGQRFRETMTVLKRMVLVVATGILLPEDIENVFQETCTWFFLERLKNPRFLADEAEFHLTMFKEVTRRVEVARRKDQRGQKVVAFEDLKPNEIDWVSRSPATPDELYNEQESFLRVHRNLALIPGRHGQVMWYFVFKDWSYAEIGQLLGVSESRAMHMGSEARKMLRKCIDDGRYFFA